MWFLVQFFRLNRKLMLFCTTLIVIVLVCILLLELTLGFYFLDNLFSYEKFCKDYLRIRKNVQNFIFLQQELKLFQQYVFFFLTDLVKSIDPVYQSITNFDFDELDLLNRGLYIPNFLEYIFYIIVFIPTLFVHFIKIVTIILANSEIENQLNPLFELVVFAINFILYIFISNNFIFEWFVSNLLDLPPIYVNGQKLPGGLMYAHILYLIIRIQFWVFCLIMLMHVYFPVKTKPYLIFTHKELFVFFLLYYVLYKSLNPYISLLLVTLIFFYFFFRTRPLINKLKYRLYLHKNSWNNCNLLKDDLRFLIIQFSLATGILIFVTMLHIFVIIRCYNYVNFYHDTSLTSLSTLNTVFELSEFFKSILFTTIIGYLKTNLQIFVDLMWPYIEFSWNLTITLMNNVSSFFKKYYYINYLFELILNFLQTNWIGDKLAFFFKKTLNLWEFYLNGGFASWKTLLTQIQFATISILYCLVLIFINLFYLLRLICFYVDASSNL